MYSQLIAAADLTPFNKPRFIRWPSVCDTTRTNWLGPEEPDPTPPSPALQNHVQYACMFDPRAGQPIDPRVLAACSSIDCIAPSADPSLTFTAVAAAPPVSPVLYTTVTCAPGLPLPLEKTAADKRAGANSPQKTDKNPVKKTGRPPNFDSAKRGQFCAMVRTGCSLRNAAKHAGVKIASVYYACRTDPAFAAQLRAAEQERDLSGVRRINSAGEKSWRAAAWVLERADPQSFSLRRQQKSDPSKSLGKRRFKQLIAEALEDILPKTLKAHDRRPMINEACGRIDERLAEMESQGSRPSEKHGTAFGDDFDAELDAELDEQPGHDQHEHGEQGGVSPINIAAPAAASIIDKPDDDPAVETAAQAAFRRILNFINQ